MQTYTNTFTGAGERYTLHIPGKFFCLLEANYAVDVTLFKGGKKLDLGNMNGVLGGLEVMTAEIRDTEPGFDRIEIVSSAADTIKIGISNGQSRYMRMTGSVQLTNVNGALSQAGKTVTTTSAAILAANPTRRYLLIQNKHAVGNVYVNLTGAFAGPISGVLIPPGGVLELNNFCPVDSITAVGDIASNASVVVVESA